MKRIHYSIIIVLFFSFSFSSNPPGWYQQQLPVNDFINDIFFLDSLNGWVATFGIGPNDTAYIIRTSDGGEKWKIIHTSFLYYSKLQFFNRDTGYASGAPGGIWRTINGGINWNLYNNGLPFGIDDMQFINFDTGWACSSDFDFGGIWRTIDGGNNWTRQLSPTSFPLLKIKAISILNKDTGWAINDGTLKELYRTTNSGTNWNVQYTFSTSGLGDVFFLNAYRGVISSGRFYFTSDGGYTWTPSKSQETGGKLSFCNDSIGWAGYNLNVISKTENGGVTWFYQLTNTSNPTPFAITPLNSWAGGIKLMHTTDGGGLSSVSQNNIEATSFILSQNYPNPFNPKTIINYELGITNYVSLKIFNVQGKEVKTLVNERQNAGKYKIEFDGNTLISGVYFYRIEVYNERGNKINSETKKMILIR